VRRSATKRDSVSSPGPTALTAIVNRFTRRLPVLLIASVLVASAAVLFRSAQRVSFHGDESGWIASGLYYSDLVLSRDFTWEKWRCRDCHAWGSLNPQLGKLMIGLPLSLVVCISLRAS
jgi:hypothetical protein